MSDKTEQATEQKKKKAREKGDTVQSKELTSAAAMLAGLILLGSAVTKFVQLWRTGFYGVMSASLENFNGPTEMLATCTKPLLPSVAPLFLLMAGAFAASLAMGAMQSGGIQIRPNAIAWKPARLNPLSNAKQIFGTRALIRFGKSLLPAGIVVFLGLQMLRKLLVATPYMSGMRLPETLNGSYQLALDAAWISVAWSGLDYGLERYQWGQRLKMSKQEIRDEAKESNGNPQTKGRIRQIQQAMRKRRVKADVSKATVVITNPTHYAVALEFSYETMSAPKVLCKGRDLHAFEIREEAKWAGVPIVENPPLARSLYRLVDEGQPIPFDLYAAVAAVLAFLFRREAQQTQQQGSYGYAGYSAAAASAGRAAEHFNLPNRIVMEPGEVEAQQ